MAGIMSAQTRAGGWPRVGGVGPALPPASLPAPLTPCARPPRRPGGADPGGQRSALRAVPHQVPAGGRGGRRRGTAPPAAGFGAPNDRAPRCPRRYGRCTRRRRPRSGRVRHLAIVWFKRAGAAEGRNAGPPAPPRGPDRASRGWSSPGAKQSALARRPAPGSWRPRQARAARRPRAWARAAA